MRVARSVFIAAARALALTTLTTGAAPCQIDPGLKKPRPADPACANALTAVGATRPGVPPDSLLVLIARLDGCVPELGQGVARAIRNFVSTSNPPPVLAAYSPAPQLIDSAIFAAARDVASNTAASLSMRILGLRTLFYYIDRDRLPYDDFVSQRRGVISCTLRQGSDTPRAVIDHDYTPLPRDAVPQARRVAAAIQDDRSASPELLSASYCVLEAWRAKTGRPSNWNWPFSTTQLTVDYVCGNRFRLRNTHPVDVSLEWGVGDLPRGRVLVAHAGNGQQFGERLLDVGAMGDLKVYYDGDLVITRRNLGTACP